MEDVDGGEYEERLEDEDGPVTGESGSDPGGRFRCVRRRLAARFVAETSCSSSASCTRVG